MTNKKLTHLEIKKKSAVSCNMIIISIMSVFKVNLLQLHNTVKLNIITDYCTVRYPFYFWKNAYALDEEGNPSELHCKVSTEPIISLTPLWKGQMTLLPPSPPLSQYRMILCELRFFFLFISLYYDCELLPWRVQ